MNPDIVYIITTVKSMYVMSPVGTITVQQGPQGLVSLQITRKQRTTGPARIKDPVLKRLENDLNGYFQGTKERFKGYHLDYGPATSFQKTVWQAVRSITWGNVRTYGWVARKIGKPKASRAVGAALGENPFLLVVPCHRVVKGNGGLGGYRAGLEKKKWLLRHEGAIK